VATPRVRAGGDRRAIGRGDRNPRTAPALAKQLHALHACARVTGDNHLAHYDLGVDLAERR
jgi:hypothetical protein